MQALQSVFGAVAPGGAQLFQSPLRIDIVLSDSATRQRIAWPAHPTASSSVSGAPAPSPSAAPATLSAPPPGAPQAFVFSSGERIAGEVRLSVAGGKRLEHAGVRLELKGVLDVASEKGAHEFAAQVLELSGPGALTGVASLPFSFARAAAPVESYAGSNARVAYLLRAVVTTRGTFAAAGALAKEVELVARNPSPMPPPPEGAGGGAGVGGAAVAAGADPDAGVKLEVGIEDCLHIEFEYSRTRYHLGDVVTGRIEFLQLGIKLKRMEVAVVRKETTGLPPNQVTTSDTLIKFEVMDGEPQKKDRVPIRVPLGALSNVLTPTLSNVGNGLLSVRYYLYLALHDEHRAYFKQQEVQLWRKTPE